jgi:uncharacterized membrane protein YkoI
MLQRRTVLKFLVLVSLAGLPVGSRPAQADDGGHDDGHSGDGHDDGHDNSHDDGHDDGHSHDDKGGDDGGDNGGDGGKGHNPKGLNQDEALHELQKGRIIPLEKALRIVDGRMPGKVIDVSLTRQFGRPQYRIKVRRTNGAISTIRLDARTGGFVGIFGF